MNSPSFSNCVGRAAHSSVLLSDGTILTIGGKSNSGFSNEVWRSSNGGLNWSLLTATAWASGVELSLITLCFFDFTLASILTNAIISYGLL